MMLYEQLELSWSASPVSGLSHLHKDLRGLKMLLPQETNRRHGGIQRSICLEGWSGNLSVCHVHRCSVAEWRCRWALPTRPPAPLTAVCCTMWSPRCSLQNNPHSSSHQSVHLASDSHIKPQHHTGMVVTVLLAFIKEKRGHWKTYSLNGLSWGGAQKHL